MNSDLAHEVIRKCLAAGIREFCLCAGARNAPLVSQLEKTPTAQIYQFFEERSAAFFALGRVRASGRPVAVVMTSGTAVAETLPAVIEGYYQGLPLVVLSADRPRAYRGTGAPQSIDQVGLFGRYAETCLDLESVEDSLDLTNWSLRRPLHINVCFQEPRGTDGELQVIVDPPASEIRKTPFFRVTPSPVVDHPVVLVGPLLEDEKPFVENFLETHEVPFVAEGPSGLNLKSAAQRRLRAPEKTLELGFQKGVFKSVLRLGGIPTLRFWRDLEEKYSRIPVLSCSNLDFTGLARPSKHVVGLDNLIYFQVKGEPESLILKHDQQLFEKLLELLDKYPRSEAALVRSLAKVSHKDVVYLGNSLPIREWDRVASDLVAPSVWANRGANGIDGQTSSFLGWTESSGKTAWALLGDLTALYDLSAPWVGPQLQDRNRRLVIMNNFGGQIFRTLFKKEIFLNRHQLRFDRWAEMWGWQYESSEDGLVFQKHLAPRQIIELLPLESQTDLFNQEWKAL